MRHLINKLVVCGVGLIGGSFALAMKKSGLVKEVIGFDRNVASLQVALEQGILDGVSCEWSSALDLADVVMLAVPIQQICDELTQMSVYLDKKTIITDVGSCKGSIVESLQKNYPDSLYRVVPAHPIAGREKHGVQAVEQHLFSGKKVVLTPLVQTQPEAIHVIQSLWEACGAQVIQMDWHIHDQIFAAVSHLPHVLAYCLVSELSARENREQLFSFAASGFKDFTRIAASDAQMWRDICVNNRDAILKEIDGFTQQCAQLRYLLEQQNDTALLQYFNQASIVRRQWALENLAPNDK